MKLCVKLWWNVPRRTPVVYEMTIPSFSQKSMLFLPSRNMKGLYLQRLMPRILLRELISMNCLLLLTPIIWLLILLGLKKNPAYISIKKQRSIAPEISRIFYLWCLTRSWWDFVELSKWVQWQITPRCKGETGVF